MSRRSRQKTAKRRASQAPASRPSPARDPQVPRLEAQAKAFYQSGRHGDALRSCLEILARQPSRADVLSFAAMLAMDVGELAEAERLYRALIALRPDLAEAHYNRGNALRRLGHLAAAADAYRRAAEANPELAPAHHNLGYTLHALERLEEAAAAYRRAVALNPDAAESHRNLGNVLQAGGRLDEAAAAYRRALAIRPDWSLVYRSLVGVLLEQRDARAALEVCDAWLEVSPADVLALAVKCAALNELGDREALGTLLDFERFVHIRQVEPPPGYADLAAFNQALARHVREHPTLKVPPEDHPTYHHPSLHITDELLAEPKGPVADLERLFHDTIEAYRAGISGGASHPFVEHWPRRWRLSSWGVVLEGQGNLVPHVHLEGYLGGVYYVALPDVVGAAPEDRAGWFELGRPPSELNFTAEPEVLSIQPVEGRMILFPGYFYHGTVPFRSAQRRISIAFDLVPES